MDANHANRGLRMANSNTVVTIDQRHFSRRLSEHRFNGKKISRQKTPVRKKIYQHTATQVLSPNQVNQMVKAAMHSPRSGLRDAALILLAYQHGFKVSELIKLKWEHIDFENRSILVSRLRDGQETLQPLDQREIELLRQLETEHSKLVFVSQGKNQMSDENIRKIIRHAGEQAGFKKTIYPGMLSAAAGFELLSNTATLLTKH